MHIDRSRFLWLTASMSPGACSGGAPAPAAAIEVAAPPTSFTPELFEDEADVEEEERRGAAPPDAGKGTLPEGDDAIAAAGPCDDAAGAPGNCEVIRAPGPQCESFTDNKGMCSKWKKGFKPKVAEKAVSCLLAMSGKRDLCDFQRPQRCAIAALGHACIDLNVSRACDPILASCAAAQYGNLTKRVCQAALSAVTDANRPRLTTCMTEGCSVDSCFWSLD